MPSQPYSPKLWKLIIPNRAVYLIIIGAFLIFGFWFSQKVMDISKEAHIGLTSEIFQERYEAQNPAFPLGKAKTNQPSEGDRVTYQPTATSTFKLHINKETEQVQRILLKVERKGNWQKEASAQIMTLLQTMNPSSSQALNESTLDFFKIDEIPTTTIPQKKSYQDGIAYTFDSTPEEMVLTVRPLDDRDFQ